MDYCRLSIDDYEEIYALWAATEGMHLTHADTREAVGAYLARNPGQSFACTSHGRVVGTVLCGNDGRRAFIYHLAVVANLRGQGIGRRLVEMAIAKQRELGIEKVVIFVMKENALGLGFWKKIGFELRMEIETLSCDT